MAPKCTLHYFNLRGRAEVIRWVFAVAKVEYEDKRYSQEEWEEFKCKTPFGQIPVLEFEDGEMLPQTDAILCYLASQYGLFGCSKRESAQIAAICGCMADSCTPFTDIYFGATEEIKKVATEKFNTVNLPKFLQYLTCKLKDGKQYLVGEKMSVADMGVARLVEDFSPEQKACVAKYSEVQALVDRILEQPEIKYWREKRPKTDL